MNTEERLPAPNGTSPFERIRRTNAAGAEYWSSRDFAQVLGYSDYRNFEQAMKKAKTACFNSGQQVEDHFGEITEMVTIRSGAQRPLRTVLLSRCACYLIVQTADPSKEIVSPLFSSLALDPPGGPRYDFAREQVRIGCWECTCRSA